MKVPKLVTQVRRLVWRESTLSYLLTILSESFFPFIDSFGFAASRRRFQINFRTAS